MSKRDLDDYLESLKEPKRSTLESLPQSILEVVPEAEQCISYGAPAFTLEGTVVVGFAAFNSRLSYLPHSGSVISQRLSRGDALPFPTQMGSFRAPLGVLRMGRFSFAPLVGPSTRDGVPDSRTWGRAVAATNRELATPSIGVIFVVHPQPSMCEN